ncbi:hypothetical protein Mro03_34410 [Microbispora rosea subsp. rosea]|nr:hypothetical protein Mro03_34410 [Microbispora rosea subsp. rosea]
MTWFITGQVFRSEAGPFLAARPDLHTMLLSGLDTIEQLRSGGKNPPTVLGWWREPDETATTAAFVWMPPHLLTADRLSQVAATHLAGLLATQAQPFTQLLADDSSVRAFSEAWRTTTGSAPKSGPHLHLYRLGRLVCPDVAPPGAPRAATDGDPARSADGSAGQGTGEILLVAPSPERPARPPQAVHDAAAVGVRHEPRPRLDRGRLSRRLIRPAVRSPLSSMVTFSSSSSSPGSTTRPIQRHSPAA